MNTEKSSRRSRLSRQLLVQYVLSLIAYVGALILFVMLGWSICSRHIWQPYDPLYIVLSFVRDYLLFFMGLALLGGWAVISYHFLSKPMKYLDEVVAASKALAAPTLELPPLSPELSEIQSELTLVRERALRDAMLAADAEQRKNDLIVYLAHDLKTPLTSVIGYLSLMQDEPQISPELRAKYTGIALEKAQRLEDLINEFFDITRFSLMTITLEKENLNLTRLLEQATNEFDPMLQEKSLTWETAFEPDIFIFADGDKLARVIDNLLRNAVNYSYADSVISVSAQKKGSLAVIRVQNSGKTIPPEKLSRIFDQFFRIDSSRASSTGGAGLGLAIAKEIVDRHGGSIKAESADDAVCFTVELPLYPQENRKNIISPSQGKNS